jgi:hypothetical protein
MRKTKLPPCSHVERRTMSAVTIASPGYYAVRDGRVFHVRYRDGYIWSGRFIGGGPAHYYGDGHQAQVANLFGPDDPFTDWQHRSDLVYYIGAAQTVGKNLANTRPIVVSTPNDGFLYGIRKHFEQAAKNRGGAQLAPIPEPAKETPLEEQTIDHEAIARAREERAKARAKLNSGSPFVYEAVAKANGQIATNAVYDDDGVYPVERRLAEELAGVVATE